MYIVAVLRDRLYCRVERSVLTVINEYVMLCYVMMVRDMTDVLLVY